jgi:hypothetical protein
MWLLRESYRGLHPHGADHKKSFLISFFLLGPMMPVSPHENWPMIIQRSAAGLSQQSSVNLKGEYTQETFVKYLETYFRNQDSKY